MYGLSLSDSINKENLKRYILSLKIVYKATLLQIYKKIIKPYITLGRGNTSDDAWGTDVGREQPRHSLCEVTYYTNSTMHHDLIIFGDWAPHPQAYRKLQVM